MAGHGARAAAGPVIGFLDLRSPEALTDRLRGFRQGLRESGYVEGDNVTVNPRRRLRLFIVLRRGIRVGRHAGPSTGLSHQVGVDVSRTRINTRIHAQFSIGNIVANAGMRDHILALVSQNGPSIGPHTHAQVPSHRSPSVKRLRIHFKGMVGSPGWLDGFPEVGRR